MMPGMDGLEFCAAVRGRPATALTPFLFVTAKGQAGDKYAGLRAGADDYVTKPFDLADLLARVNGRLEHRRRIAALEQRLAEARHRWAETDEPGEMRLARDEQSRLADEVYDAGYVDFEPPRPDAAVLREKIARFERRFPALEDLRRRSLVGEAPCFLRLFEEILIAAASPDANLILGETGTGKTAVAEAIWLLGTRAGRAFRTINCSELAAGDPAIATGKLFGYGTGSGLANVPREGQPGILEETDGGVLFLDEVGDLPRQAQALLLLPLEGRPFHPAVGRGPARTVDVKFVCATNRDLAEEVQAGRFPRDLYERLAGHVIHVPPLRARPEDVARLATHFLREAMREMGGAELGMSPAAGEVLSRHNWPGNARELRRAVRQSAQRARLDGRATVEPTDLPAEILARAAPPREAPPPAAATGSRPEALRRAGFTDREVAEIAALCATGFRVGEAEALLGYSTKSRTFSHRLRGLSLKALSLTRFSPEAAAELLTGADSALTPLAARRLRAVLESLAERVHDAPGRVLTNLLTEHRRYALEALAHLRRRR
jgi:DNA-binding NtrC family response regulator